MASKSNQGQTKKYSNVVKTVKNSQQEEEPRITAEQVIAAFKSFGFEPNERNHNDIGYWTTKGQSEGVKLMEELHKRRMDIIKEEDEKEKSEKAKKKAEEDVINQQNESKKTLPRLSDQDLAALFDEYGLAAPDPEWSRTHLPNDPKKIRSILEMQRKMADDMLKKHAKNSINSIPEVPKANMMGMGGYYGKGGPTPGMPPVNPVGAQGDMLPPESPATPFFIGDHSIVRIVNPTNPQASTIWLVDAKRKVLQPFISEEAFENAFEDPEAAKQAIVTISTKELGPGGALDGFKPLPGNQGVGSDGSIESIEFSPAELQNRYGQQQDPNAESRALSMLDGIFGKLNSPQ